MIKFGPSGNSDSFYAAGLKTSEQSAVFVKDAGLNAFEYSFGRGINMGDERAVSICQAFKKNQVEISAHAPYYINFANPDNSLAAKSFNYVLQTAKKLKLMGGRRIVFHSATQGKLEREKAVLLTLDRIKELTDYIYLNNLEDMIFCPETMGKLGQIGTIEEIARICEIDKIYVPAIDFGHINSREQGSLISSQDYKSRLEILIDKLGIERMRNFHTHFSKIEYGEKGEIRHLTFSDTKFGPPFEPLAEALLELDLQPVIICESAGTQLEDALYMKNIYHSLKK